MKKFAIWTLVIVNALLLVKLFDQRFLATPSAVAQARRPSEYLMVPGDVNGVGSGVVFMLDVNTGMLSMMSYDGRNLDAAQPIDLNNVFARAAGAGGGKNKKDKP